MISKKKYKIATILPYKESYTLENASAVSLWVSEFFNKSKFKNDNYIFGNANSRNYLTNNYINVPLKNLKLKFRSTSNEYIEKLSKKLIEKKFDIIEIHNRPLVLFKLLNKINSKFIMYYHNDPLTMSGSKLISERKEILKKVDKLVFISKWVKKRFFEGLDDKDNKTEIIYHSVYKRKKKFKVNQIVFVGKLNHSKGYDLFKDSIIKILDEFPKWNALSIGDESRRSIYIKHKNHKECGFLNHKKTLDILDKSEIAVVPSRWEEPFGRVSLEATASGCVTITSDKGGLLETSNHTISINNIDANKLYKNIKSLIKNKIKRKKIQNLARNNINHLIDKNTKKIDLMRANIFPEFQLNYLKNKLKIINLFNQGQKSNYRLFNISLGKKFTNGFIRNNHDVVEISDRDFIKNNRNILNFKSNINMFQNHLIEVVKNYNPDLFLFGHTNNINLETLDKIRSINKQLIISQWNEDPLMPGLEFSNKNIRNIEPYVPLVDHNFITTHPSILKDKFKDQKFNFFFVPVDKNIECYNVYKLNPKKDIFYAMSHGVNRGVLKKGFEDNRINFLNKLIKKIPSLNYDFHGFDNKQPIWGNDFNNALINSKMGLNLSRGNPTKYYSSNRIASLLGNGLLTFIDKKTKLDDFFINEKDVIFYYDINDLASKIKFYSKNDKLRKEIAKNGKAKYFKLFDGNKISKYIIDVSLGKKTDLFR
jgi:glycosyltransferase involved in cell wall biosynthesis|tara:strand:- start:842 stop:2965 length:2124 start_codon:yes stop_codon:yes gene_type:complete